MGVTAQAQDMKQYIKRDELPKLIAEYLKNNPEVIIESLQGMEDKNKKQAQNNIPPIIKKIVADPNVPYMGAKDGDVVIVEFMDYNCGYCKKQFADLMKLMGDDNKIKVIIVDYPILAQSSFSAAMGSLFAHKAGKFSEFHQQMIAKRELSDNVINEFLSNDLKIDDKTLKDAKLITQFQNLIKNNLENGRKMGVNGTPALIITDKNGVMASVDKAFVPGYVAFDTLKSLVGEARKK